MATGKIAVSAFLLLLVLTDLSSLVRVFLGANYDRNAQNVQHFDIDSHHHHHRIDNNQNNIRDYITQHQLNPITRWDASRLDKARSPIYSQPEQPGFILLAAAKGVAGLGKAGGDGTAGSDKAGQQVPPEVYNALTYAGTAFLFTLSVPLILYGLNKLLNKIEDCFGCGPSSARKKALAEEQLKIRQQQEQLSLKRLQQERFESNLHTQLANSIKSKDNLNLLNPKQQSQMSASTANKANGQSMELEINYQANIMQQQKQQQIRTQQQLKGGSPYFIPTPHI